MDTTDKVETRSVVGDDGELIENDSNVDMAVYYDSIADPYPPPTLLERMQYALSTNPWVWLGILVVVIIIGIFIWPYSPPRPQPTPYRTMTTEERLRSMLVPTRTPSPTPVTCTPIFRSSIEVPTPAD